jgi:hypothetical protein
MLLLIEDSERDLFLKFLNNPSQRKLDYIFLSNSLNQKEASLKNVSY